ncbi:MAG: DNA-binding transcriptional regulator, LysR family [Gammaproteobacteria bacterium]|nr:DNA-binding transcriptional regulator, LysR family [Gammaproteobacteria bacterium]
MTCQYVAFRIVPAVLRPEGDGRVLEEAFETQTPIRRGRRDAFRVDASGSIDRMGGQHVHAGEKEGAAPVLSPLSRKCAGNAFYMAVITDAIS